MSGKMNKAHWQRETTCLEAQECEVLRHEALVTYGGKRPELHVDVSSTREDLVNMIEDWQPQNTNELADFIQQ